MSTYSTPVGTADRESPGRPGTLTAGFWLSVVVGVLSLLAGVVAIVGGRASVHDFAAATAKTALGDDATLIDGTVDQVTREAYQSLVVKAVVGIVLAVAILAFAFAARSGALWARILLTVALVAGMCGGSGLQLRDRAAMPGGTVVLASLIPLLSLIAIVTLYLPATNRYAAARRAAR